MIETIVARNLPDQFSGTYEAPGMWNLVENHFIEQGSQQTLWRMDTEFQGKTLMMKLMTFFMPGMFKKQTAQMMNQFKAFAENAS